jgi:hypothetical protein
MEPLIAARLLAVGGWLSRGLADLKKGFSHGASASPSPCHEIAEVAEATEKSLAGPGFLVWRLSGREPES